MGGYRRNFDNPFYLYLKDHFCPRCGNKLFVSKKSSIVRGGSEIAKQLDLNFDGTPMTGDITVVNQMFCCRECNFKSTIKYMKDIEFADIKMPRVYEDSNTPFLKRIKRHNCKDCGAALFKDNRRIVLNCNSPKLNDYKIKGRYSSENYQEDIEFIECFYRCKSCGKVLKDTLH